MIGTRRRAPLLATGAAGALTLALTALPATAQNDEAEVSEVRGHASGIFVELDAFLDGTSFDATFGPEPSVSLPPEGGGPFTDSLAEAILDGAPDDINDVLGFDFEVSTEGALGTDGFAESSSELNADLFNDAFLAEVISTECRTDLVDGPTGSTTVLGGEFSHPDDGPSSVPENPEPNTVLIDFEFDDVENGTGDIVSILMVLNEQTVTDNDITVVGLSLFIDIQELEGGQIVEELLIEATVAESSCGLDITEPPEPPEPIEPTTTTTTQPADGELPVEAVTAAPRFTG